MASKPLPKIARHYKVSEIKQKLLHPAQASVFSVNILTNPNVNNFIGLGSRDQESINLACCEASLPGSSLATHESNNDYHGTSEKMAYRRIYDDTLDLTFYVDYKYNTLKYFLAWMSFIVGEGNYFTQNEYIDPTTFYRMTYPKSYKTQISVLKFEKDITRSSPKYRIGYDFIDAFPINIASTPVSYEQSDLLKVTVSFNYSRYVIASQFSPYTATARTGPAPSTEAPLQAAQNTTNLFGGGLDLGNQLGIEPINGSTYTLPEGPGYAAGFDQNISLVDIPQNTSPAPPTSAAAEAENQQIVAEERRLIEEQQARREAQRLLDGETVGGTSFTLF